MEKTLYLWKPVQQVENNAIRTSSIVKIEEQYRKHAAMTKSFDPLLGLLHSS